MRRVIGLCVALAFFTGTSTVALADQTVTITIPLTFTSIPPQVGESFTRCYVYPPSVPLGALASNLYGGSVLSLSSGLSAITKFTGTSYSGNVVVPVVFPDAQIAGITQPLPYQCWVMLFPPSGPTGPSDYGLKEPQYVVLPSNQSLVIVSGTIPIATGRTGIGPAARTTP